MEIIVFIINVLFVPLISPLCIGVVRKVKAIMQNRQGASVLQPYRDLLKLFHKDEVVPKSASWIFLVTPYLLFALTLIIASALPFLSIGNNLFGINDFLVIIYLFMLSSFFLSLAGIDSASSFGGFGSSREMTVLALTEGGLFFSILPIVLLTQSTNLSQMTFVLSGLPLVHFVPVFISFIAFFIALLAENSRIPFDNPATHLELTMIHEAMILEYSGKRLALIEWAAFNKFVIFIIIAVTLFFPWGIHIASTFFDILSSLFLTFVKVTVLIGIVALIESTTAKLRFFRLPDLLFTSFMLGVIALFLVVTRYG